MQGPPLLRAIYAELRASAGSEIAAGDLLRLAHVILRAYKSDFIEPTEEIRGRDRSAGFHSLPVDQAMQDGGWRILNFEAPRSPLIDEMGPETMMYLHHQLTKFLGHEWQKLAPPG